MKHHLPSSIITCPFPVGFATLVGSTIYGAATPESDYDISGVFVAPLRDVLGFSALKETHVEKTMFQDTSVDIVLHELKKFLSLLLKGNGNALEVLYSPLVITTSTLHDRIKILGKECITQFCGHHYRGMAHNQLRQPGSEVKKLFHAYRCFLMGIELMKTGIFHFDVEYLANTYQCPEMLDILALKQQRQSDLVFPSDHRYMNTLSRLDTQLDEAIRVSFLPPKPSDEIKQQIESLLFQTRMMKHLFDSFS